MNAILTRYIGPSNTRGARIVAESDGRRVYTSLDHALSGEDRHRPALVRFLADNPGWPQSGWVAGYWRTGGKQGYAWVYVETQS